MKKTFFHADLDTRKLVKIRKPEGSLVFASYNITKPVKSYTKKLELKRTTFEDHSFCNGCGEDLLQEIFLELLT